MSDSCVVPWATQMVAPPSGLSAFTPSFFDTMMLVELRTSISISPDFSARKRRCAESRTNLVLVTSPGTAAATAPRRPTSTPQITWPRFFTTSTRKAKRRPTGRV